MELSLFLGSEETIHSAEINDTSYEPPNCFSSGKNEFFFLKKTNQNGPLKKDHFSAPPILNIFSQKFHGLVL